MKNLRESHQLDKMVSDILKGEASTEALKALNRHCAELRELFSQNPEMAVTGELFETTKQLSHHCYRIASYFAEHGHSEKEESAWRTRHELLMTAYPHRRDLVGPAKLDWANSLRKLGQAEKAERLYELIIDSISAILPWGPTFNEAWITSIKCLESTIKKSSTERGELLRKVTLSLQESQDMRQEHLRSQT